MSDGVDQGTTPSPQTDGSASDHASGSVFDREELWAQLPLCPDWPDLN